MSENLDLVRSIYADWERGDFGSAEWAHPEIEYVSADGPDPGAWTGLAEMGENFRAWLGLWEEFRLTADEYRQLGAENVIVLDHYSGRGKTSGLDLGQIQTSGAWAFHIRDGKVTRMVRYMDRANAVADLGLEELAVSQENVEKVRAWVAKGVLGVTEAEFNESCDPAAELIALRSGTEGSYRGLAGFLRFQADTATTFEKFQPRYEEFHAVGDRVLFGGTIRVRGAGSGVEMDIPAWNVVDFRDGKISRWESFGSKADALKAVGLAE